MFFNKRKLNEDQLSKANSLGQFIGNKISKSKRLRKIYLKLYRLGNKNPKLTAGILLSFASLALSISLYQITRTNIEDTSSFDTPIPVHSGNLHRYDDSIRIVQQGIENVFIEAKQISDSIQTILRKEKLTREDSIYVVIRGKYLEEITNIIQNKP